MGDNDLTPEAKAAIDEAVRIVNSDRTHRLNAERVRKILREEMETWKPPAPTPPPTPEPPTPTPPTPPPPVNPPPPPNDPPKPKRRFGYWPDAEE